MKKIRFAGLLLLAPVVLLSGCTSYVPLNFTANWHANTADRSVGNTQESLSYTVTFEQNKNIENFSIEYETGTYTTTLRNDNITLASGKSAEGYVYTTRLDIKGRFRLNGTDGETFTDYVSSEVRFLPATEGLRPVSSKKEVHTTSPLTNSPATLEVASRLYHYTFDVEYDDELLNATSKYTDLVANTAPIETKLNIDGKHTFLDNEQILFALRGLPLTSAFSFSTVHTVDDTIATVSGSSLEVGKETFSFTADGKEISEEISTRRLLLQYTDSRHPGAAQRLVYAECTNVSNNRFRNVLLKMEAPVLHSLGTMIYTLNTAQFVNK